MANVSIKSLAIALAKADSAFELVIPRTAADLARALGTSPTYDAFTATCTEFRTAYIAERKCTEKTAENRLSEVLSFMSNNFEFVKPSKPTVAAEKKKAERSKKAVTVSEAKAQCATIDDALMKAAAAAKAGDAEKASAYNAVVTAMTKQASSEASKAASEALRNERLAIKKLLSDCTDIDVLREVHDLLTGVKPVSKQAKQAKASTVGKKTTVKKTVGFEATGVLVNMAKKTEPEESEI